MIELIHIWHDKERGFTYLAVLFFIAIGGIGLSDVGVIWHTAQKIEKEKVLLFIGNQFRQAIKAFYNGVPGVHMYPAQLQVLLQDPRQVEPRRYLRKIYVDPFMGKRKWGTVKAPGGGIMGVHSLSFSEPIKRTNFPDGDAEFAGAKTYQNWIFLYTPTSPRFK